MGRKTKLTNKTIKIIVDCLLKGNYISTTCDLVGISESTFFHWLDKAELYKKETLSTPRKPGNKLDNEEAERYINFFEAVKSAQARSESGLVGRIDEAGSLATMIESKTTTKTLKDGSTTTETVERWKPPDWQANAWILERTQYAKYGLHTSLDIQQSGMIFIERLQKARQQKVIDGEFSELDNLAAAPHPEEKAPERPLPQAARQKKCSGQRPLKTRGW
jgi:hypothetical protein